MLDFQMCLLKLAVYYHQLQHINQDAVEDYRNYQQFPTRQPAAAGSVYQRRWPGTVRLYESAYMK
ncbi:MAG: hypothetical protein PF630_05475 [Gammaproteobacteria bacterium]|jgi:hypothetical protein|nr:hypothetical protein [Gammaproteobacteria bacterium]